ncbi:MAG: hypothetical protein GY846_02045, partial [Deltaproteobacteria bacterium]|nr:hypothetical protein [Deltaproteobacteria bacterium]
MKNPIIKNSLFYGILFCFTPGFIILCSALTVFSNQQGVVSRVKKATQKLDKTHQVDAIIPVPKNIVRVNMAYQGGTFFTEARKSEIKRFKCSSCHNNKKV